MFSVTSKLGESGDLSKKHCYRYKSLTDFFPFHLTEVLASRCQHLNCCRENNNTGGSSNGFPTEFCSSQEQRNLRQQNADTHKTFGKLIPVRLSELFANRSKNLDCGGKDHHLSSTLDDCFTVGTHSFGCGNHHSRQTCNTNQTSSKLLCIQISNLFKCARQNQHCCSNSEHSSYTLHHTSCLTADFVEYSHRSKKFSK